MWVDQKDLKLYITGADMPRIHAAARLVGDLISKAPVNVNSAGVEDEVRVMTFFFDVLSLRRYCGSSVVACLCGTSLLAGPHHGSTFES